MLQIQACLLETALVTNSLFAGQLYVYIIETLTKFTEHNYGHHKNIKNLVQLQPTHVLLASLKGTKSCL